MFWTNVLIDGLLVIFVVNCLLMCLVILMQRSKQEGLGAAFGGGFTESVWGAQTSQVLVKATVIMAAIFFIVSISLARLYSHKASLIGQTPGSSAIQQELSQPVAPAPTATNALVAPALPTTTAVTTAPAPVAPTTVTNAPASAAPVKPATK